MRALAVVGFSNLTEDQQVVAHLVPQLSSRLSDAFATIQLKGLPGGVFLCCYFERHSTGRTPVHLRAQDGTLIVRLDVVAPDPDCTADTLLGQFASLLATLPDRLSQYLQRRGESTNRIQHVRNAIALSVSSESAGAK